ncbi:CS domain-containing protein [Artemisia annua]|uniref:CS domain-containing protein n=1 Tax=Artemisia annua TaxID=35608 RepID=A0A2U1KHZ5_ARTAN|nr:CS domain-containing protein [Artemisia annua]
MTVEALKVSVMIIDINDEVSRTFIELLGLGLEDGVRGHSLPINNMMVFAVIIEKGSVGESSSTRDEEPRPPFVVLVPNCHNTNTKAPINDVKLKLGSEGKFYFFVTVGTDNVPYEIDINLQDKVDVNALKKEGKTPAFVKVDWDK